MTQSDMKDIRISKKILNEIDELKEITGDISLEEFSKSIIIKKAVAMTIINIGELSSNYSENLRDQNSHIPWRDIKSMRNIAAHKYEVLSSDKIWNTVKKDIPDFENQIKNILFNLKIEKTKSDPEMIL